jgi:hypothetical protein
MKQRTIMISMILAILVLLAAACTPEEQDGAPAVQQEDVYQNILERIRATGAEVVLDTDVIQPLVPADTRLFRINGELVQLMVFTDEVTRRASEAELDLRAGLIPETGTTTVDNLYYWSYEQTVAMYVGEKQDVIDAVTAALGEPTMVAQDGTPVEAPLETPVD